MTEWPSVPTSLSSRRSKDEGRRVGVYNSPAYSLMNRIINLNACMDSMNVWQTCCPSAFESSFSRAVLRLWFARGRISIEIIPGNKSKKRSKNDAIAEKNTFVNFWDGNNCAVHERRGVLCIMFIDAERECWERSLVLS